jgi:hypothetical protein
MKRIQQILLAILLVQAIISVIVYWPSEASTITGELLLGNFTADEVEFISIRDIDGNYLELSKSGSDWVLPVVGNFPANSEKVEQIIDKILAIKSNRLVTRTESSHQRLQLRQPISEKTVKMRFSLLEKFLHGRQQPIQVVGSIQYICPYLQKKSWMLF